MKARVHPRSLKAIVPSTEGFILKSSSQSVLSSSCSIPGRSTTEQLRLNHIETLEILQTTVDENDVLKKQLTVLQKKLNSIATAKCDVAMNDDLDGADDDDNENKGDDSTFTVIRILEQDKEIKVLKSKIVSAEMEIRRLQGVAEGNARRPPQPRFTPASATATLPVPAVVSTSSEDHSDNAISKELEEHKRLLVLALDNADSAESSLVELKEELAVKCKENDILTNLNRTDQQKIAEASLQIENLLLRQEQLESQAVEAANRITSLEETAAGVGSQQLDFEDQVVEKWNESKRLLDVAKDYTEKLEAKYQAAVTKADSLEMQGSTFEMTAATLERKVVTLEETLRCMQLQAPQSHKGVADTEMDKGSGFRFDEYVRLKRENRELKLQLVDMSRKKE